MQPIGSPLSDTSPQRNNENCQNCELHQQAKTVCCETEGDGTSGIFLVGEALGATEDEYGAPFLGDAGAKLNYALRKSGIDRGSLFLGNSVRCRPPKNRNPKKKEMVACAPYLLYDILINKPKVIVPLGSIASEMICDDWFYTVDVLGKKKRLKKKLDKWRGYPQKYTFKFQKGKKVFAHTCWVVPTYHPSACLHAWEKDDLLIHDLKLAAEYAEGNEVLKLPDTKVHVAKTMEEVKDLVDYMRAEGRYVTDLETTGVRAHADSIICAGFASRKGEAHVIPFLKQCTPEVKRVWWSRADELQIKKWLIDLFSDTEVMGQGIKFDVKFYRAFLGWHAFNIAADSQIMHHVLDENKPHNLNFISQQLLRWTRYDTDIDHYKSEDELDLSFAPQEKVWDYCGIDCDGTNQCIEAMEPMLAEQKLRKANRIEHGLILPLADLEYVGVHASRSRLEELSKQYRKEKAQSEAYLNRTAQRLFFNEDMSKFNPNSNAQLTRLLQAAGASLTKKTRAGSIAVDKTVLKALSLGSGVPATIAKHVLNLRKMTKYISTYLDGKDGSGGVLQFITPRGRIHPDYAITKTRTGRLAAERIITFPRQGGLRTMIVPDGPDDVFLNVDYSKLELRVMAWLANDPVMIKELLAGIDLHMRMAVTARLMRDPTDEEFEEIQKDVSPNERAVAKGVNFGIPYGRGSFSIVQANPESFPDEMDRRSRVKMVDRIIESYYDKYQGIGDHMRREVRIAHKRQWLRSFTTGRKRRLTGMDWFHSDEAAETKFRDKDVEHVEREAQNFQIQEIASAILAEATKRCYDGIQSGELDIRNFRIVMSVHDQLIFNVYRDDVEEAWEFVQEAMQTVLPKGKSRYRIQTIEMPITIDKHVQSAWGEDEYD